MVCFFFSQRLFFQQIRFFPRERQRRRISLEVQFLPSSPRSLPHTNSTTHIHIICSLPGSNHSNSTSDRKQTRTLSGLASGLGPMAREADRHKSNHTYSAIRGFVFTKALFGMEVFSHTPTSTRFGPVPTLSGRHQCRTNRLMRIVVATPAPFGERFVAVWPWNTIRKIPGRELAPP